MIFFESWQELFRVAVSALLVYPFVILSVRISGKRSTSKMNNFDWIVTVAMGSIVGSAILLKDVVMIEVFLSISMLLGLQYVVTKASTRFPAVSRAVRARPALLFFDGLFQEQTMAKERITKEEIKSAIRASGFCNLSEVGAVIMEADASLSVLQKTDNRPGLLDEVR